MAIKQIQKLFPYFSNTSDHRNRKNNIQMRHKNLRKNFKFVSLSDNLLTTTVETVLCAVSAKPWECIRQQAGRVLNDWEDVVKEKRDELLGKWHHEKISVDSHKDRLIKIIELAISNAKKYVSSFLSQAVGTRLAIGSINSHK